jgi:hypothetical protein
MSNKWDAVNKEIESRGDAKYGTPEYDAWETRVRAELEKVVGQTWDTRELERDFIIDSFAYCLAFGRRKSDNKRVSIDFMHSPRFYFSVIESD